MSGALLDHLWQSTLFGAAVWTSALLLRNNSAALRHWLWLLASLKFLVPFSVLYALGAATVSSLSPAATPAGVDHALIALRPLVSPATVTVTAPASANATQLLVPALLTLWMLGCLWMTLRWIHGWRQAQAISRAARRGPGPAPDTCVVDADIEPSVAHVFRPVVLLPATLLGRLSAAQLEAVLAHEREHIQRRDNLKAQLHALVEILFWFHPLVWLIGHRLLDERERACDEAVLSNGHDPAEYAAGILAVCRHCAAALPRQSMGSLAGDLVQRVRHILSADTPSSLGFTKAFMLTTCTAVLTLGPMAAGALDQAAHRRAVADSNARILRDARVLLNPSVAADGSPALHVSDRQLWVRNSSLRELLAMAYGVDESAVAGRDDRLDAPRYDLRAVVRLREPADFDPVSLRPLVTKLLAARFNLEVHVDQQCQDPCGPHALR
jgi:bla regulator protein BlaR1